MIFYVIASWFTNYLIHLFLFLTDFVSLVIFLRYFIFAAIILSSSLLCITQDSYAYVVAGNTTHGINPQFYIFVYFFLPKYRLIQNIIHFTYLLTLIPFYWLYLDLTSHLLIKCYSGIPMQLLFLVSAFWHPILSVIYYHCFTLQVNI